MSGAAYRSGAGARIGRFGPDPDRPLVGPAKVLPSAARPFHTMRAIGGAGGRPAPGSRARAASPAHGSRGGRCPQERTRRGVPRRVRSSFRPGFETGFVYGAGRTFVA